MLSTLLNSQVYGTLQVLFSQVYCALRVLSTRCTLSRVLCFECDMRLSFAKSTEYATVINYAPSAFIFLRIHMIAPYFWSEHPWVALHPPNVQELHPYLRFPTVEQQPFPSWIPLSVDPSDTTPLKLTVHLVGCQPQTWNCQTKSLPPFSPSSKCSSISKWSVETSGAHSLHFSSGILGVKSSLPPPLTARLMVSFEVCATFWDF
jgi:hypothetical protein